MNEENGSTQGEYEKGPVNQYRKWIFWIVGGAVGAIAGFPAFSQGLTQLGGIKDMKVMDLWDALVPVLAWAWAFGAPLGIALYMRAVLRNMIAAEFKQGMRDFNAQVVTTRKDFADKFREIETRLPPKTSA